jgi:hypothetical protein
MLWRGDSEKMECDICYEKFWIRSEDQKSA